MNQQDPCFDVPCAKHGFTLIVLEFMIILLLQIVAGFAATVIKMSLALVTSWTKVQKI